jgi:hypothetical protein
VVETEPVTGLVGERAAQVVVGGAAARDGGEEHNDTVILGGAGVRRGEGGVAEETGTRARLEADGVDVESGYKSD